MRDPQNEELLKRLQLGDERALSELSTLTAPRSTSWPSVTCAITKTRKK